MMLCLFGLLFGDISYGSAKSGVVLVAYFDLGCDACRDFHKDVWPQIKKRWCRFNGPLRVIFKPYPVIEETITFMACCEKLIPRQRQLLFETLMDIETPSMVAIKGCMKVLNKPFVAYTSAVLKEVLLMTTQHQFIALPVLFVNGQRLSDDQQDNIIHYLEEIL